MQDHRQAMALRQPQLLAVALPLALAQRGRAEFRHEEIEPDLADRDQARVVGATLELGGQRLQVLGAGARHQQRVDAERIGVAGPVRELAHGSKVGALDRRVDAQAHAQGARPFALDKVVGAAQVQAWGGRVVLVDVEQGHSTTRLVGKAAGKL